MNYIKISKCDTANGTGIGVVLWVSGCNCHCHGCHNPQTWDFNAGQPFTEDTMQEILEALDKPYISRLTFSGGHPLDPKNIDTVAKISQEVYDRFPTIKQWLYTGYEWNYILCFDILKTLHIVVDGAYLHDKRDISLAWRGSSNQRVIDVQESLKHNKVVLYCE